MGAYKIRGAVHAILQLPPDLRAKGVVTHSSGNFAQALALAANELGVTATIVMPSNASPFKKKAVEDYGGIVRNVHPLQEAREAMAEERQTGDRSDVYPSVQ